MLVRVVDSLAQCPRVALDTEINSMHAYEPRVCLVTLCEAHADEVADEVFVVDTLAMPSLLPLVPLLGGANAVPIVHDVSFDARKLAAEGVALEHALDTALHARFLGLAATGLAGLLGERFGLKLSKEHQRANWGRRPLHRELIEYVINDVAYLGPLASQLEREADALGVLDEVAVETAWALASAREVGDGAPPYAELKGTRELSPDGRAVLRSLWLVRDRLARRLNTPPGQVVGSQGLIRVTRSRPRDVASFRAASASQVSDALLQELVDAIADGERDGDVPEEERHWFAIVRSPSGEISRRRAREEALSAWRAAEAELRGVSPQVVLPGHVLADLAKLAPHHASEMLEVPGFGQVRVDRYGDELIAMLRGFEKS